LTTLLPPAPTPAQYDHLRNQPETWNRAIKTICRRHGYSATDLHPYPNGSNVVCGQGQSRIIKLFPPFLRHQHEAERLALTAVQGKLRVATPEVLAEGTLEDWPYLVLTLLPGTPLEHLWPELPLSTKVEVMERIGHLMAEVHHLPVSSLSRLEPEWQPFLRQQKAQCLDRHRRLWVPKPLLRQLESYLSKAEALLPPQFSPVLLTGEYTPENLLLTQQHGQWALSGLIDFGDAMLGYREYDLLGPGTFLAAGQPHLLRPLLLGYGYPEKDLTSELARRLTVLLLLHRYSNLRVQVRIPGWEERVQSWEELEKLLWRF
jgi:hygromycin-B 7''-O-kinase